MKKNIAFFVSGGGSDMQSVLDAIDDGKVDGKAVYVVCTKDGIGAIGRAKKHGIPYGIFKKDDYESAEARDRAIIGELKAYEPDLIVFAGYLGIVTPLLVNAYRGKIINIHPSLIPKHCGKGFYGIRVHESVIRSGDKESGATIHFVDEGTDTGEIIMQQRVPVLDGDTPQALAERVLELEHKMLPAAVAQLLKK